MSPYWMVLPAGLCVCFSSWLAYQKPAKTAGWFLVVMVLLSAFNGLLWAVASRLSVDGRQLFSVSALWDATTITAYSLLPLLLCGVRLNGWSWLGLVLMVAGALLITFSKEG